MQLTWKGARLLGSGPTGGGGRWGGGIKTLKTNKTAAPLSRGLAGPSQTGGDQEADAPSGHTARKPKRLSALGSPASSAETRPKGRSTCSLHRCPHGWHLGPSLRQSWGRVGRRHSSRDALQEPTLETQGGAPGPTSPAPDSPPADRDTAQAQCARPARCDRQVAPKEPPTC